MIEEVGRAVAQKVSFNSHTRYRPADTPRSARALFHEGDLTTRGIYSTAEDMNLAPGEIVAVWELPADEARTIRQAAQDLPPRPSRLMVRGADGKLLELNPRYIDINNRPEGYVEFTPEERASYGL